MEGQRDTDTLLVKEGKVEVLWEGLVEALCVGVRLGVEEVDTLPVRESLEEALLDPDTEGVAVLEGVTEALEERDPG